MNAALACAVSLLALITPPTASQTDTPATVPSDLATPDLITIGENDVRMTVPVRISDSGPYHFVIDTGAERTVISRELAANLGLVAGTGVRVTAMANTQNVATVIIPRISVGVIGGERIEAPAFDLRDIGAPGMLGIDTLQGHAVTIDFDRGEMSVSPSIKHRRVVRDDPDEIVVRARDMFGQLVVTDAWFHNRRVRVVIDTGSEVTMGNLALRKLVSRKPAAFQQISLRAVTGVSLAADYAQIGAVRIGSTVIDNLPVAFADAPPFAHFGLGGTPALMLGMDALRLFRRVTIDFPNRELRLLLPRNTQRVPVGWGTGRA